MDGSGLRLIALVAAGGALGSVARYGLSGLLTRGPFPWGTFVVNFSGTFLLVLLYVLAMDRGYLSVDWRTFLFVGLFGGYTTFSTFGLETIALLREGQPLLASLNVGLNAGLCLAGGLLAAALGQLVGGG